MQWYILKCFDQLINKYGLKGPFLDAGGGLGEVSQFLAKRGWNGKLVDSSERAVQKAMSRLREYDVLVVKRRIEEETGVYNTVVLFDVLEHIKDDEMAVKKIRANLRRGGHLAVTIPLKQKEWRWDDELNGHYRRYELGEFLRLMQKYGFRPLEVADYTFPFFWLARRLLTFAWPAPLEIEGRTKEELTELRKKSFETVMFIKMIEWRFLWFPVYFVQDCFKWGHYGFEGLIIFRRE